MLWSEAQIARERINGRIATDTVMLQAVINCTLSTKKDKSAIRHLESLLRGLRNGG